MKHLLLLLVLLTLTGCEVVPTEKQNVVHTVAIITNVGTSSHDIRKVQIEGCDYWLTQQTHGYVAITHSGTCKQCATKKAEMPLEGEQ